MTMNATRMMDYAAPTQTAPADHGRRQEDDRFGCLATACRVVATGRGGARSATVLLGIGAADAALAPERVASLEGRYHVYLEVLDRGSVTTNACVRITRPPEAGPIATRYAGAASRLVGWLTGRNQGPARR